MPPATPRTGDRRVQRTQALLREALHALIHEKPYDAIVVKEILHRANVGRSTFYSHFRDKDDLLASGIRRMVGAPVAPRRSSAKPFDDVLWFSLPFLEHLELHRAAPAGRMGVPERDGLHERLAQVLLELVRDPVRRALGRRARPRGDMPADLIADFVVSTFIRVLDWWAGSDDGPSAAEADALFRGLVEPGLAAACRQGPGPL